MPGFARGGGAHEPLKRPRPRFGAADAGDTGADCGADRGRRSGAQIGHLRQTGSAIATKLRLARVSVVKQEMTAKGSAHRPCHFAKALRMLGPRAIFTRPDTPKTNGKAKRFIQTLRRDWAHGLIPPT